MGHDGHSRFMVSKEVYLMLKSSMNKTETNDEFILRLLLYTKEYSKAKANLEYFRKAMVNLKQENKKLREELELYKRMINTWGLP